MLQRNKTRLTACCPGHKKRHNRAVHCNMKRENPMGRTVIDRTDAIVWLALGLRDPRVAVQPVATLVPTH